MVIHELLDVERCAVNQARKYPPFLSEPICAVASVGEALPLLGEQIRLLFDDLTERRRGIDQRIVRLAVGIATDLL